MADDRTVERLARSVKAMAHPIRFKVLQVLKDREASVGDLSQLLDTSESNLCQHLAILRSNALVVSRKEGNHVYYRVKDRRTLRLLEMMRTVFCE